MSGDGSGFLRRPAAIHAMSRKMSSWPDETWAQVLSCDQTEVTRTQVVRHFRSRRQFCSRFVREVLLRSDSVGTHYGDSRESLREPLSARGV